MKTRILKLASTNKGYNMLCDIRDAYEEVLKYHIRRNIGTNFAFKTSSCAEADVVLINAIAKFIAKVEGISPSLSYIGCGINDVQFGVDTGSDSTLGVCNNNSISATSIKIRSEFKSNYDVFDTLLHEIVHWTQNKMIDYLRDSSDVEYEDRKQEIQAFTISELIINMMKSR